MGRQFMRTVHCDTGFDRRLSSLTPSLSFLLGSRIILLALAENNGGEANQAHCWFESSLSIARLRCNQSAAVQHSRAQSAPAVQPARTSDGQWTPRYTRVTPTAR